MEKCAFDWIYRNFMLITCLGLVVFTKEESQQYSYECNENGDITLLGLLQNSQVTIKGVAYKNGSSVFPNCTFTADQYGHVIINRSCTNDSTELRPRVVVVGILEGKSVSSPTVSSSQTSTPIPTTTTTSTKATSPSRTSSTITTTSTMTTTSTIGTSKSTIGTITSMTTTQPTITTPTTTTIPTTNPKTTTSTTTTPTTPTTTTKTPTTPTKTTTTTTATIPTTTPKSTTSTTTKPTTPTADTTTTTFTPTTTTTTTTTKPITTTTTTKAHKPITTHTSKTTSSTTPTTNTTTPTSTTKTTSPTTPITNTTTTSQLITTPSPTTVQLTTPTPPSPPTTSTSKPTTSSKPTSTPTTTTQHTPALLAPPPPPSTTTTSTSKPTTLSEPTSSTTTSSSSSSSQFRKKRHFKTTKQIFMLTCQQYKNGVIHNILGQLINRDTISLNPVFNSVGRVEMQFKSYRAETEDALKYLPDISTVYLGDMFFMFLKYTGQQDYKIVPQSCSAYDGGIAVTNSAKPNVSLWSYDSCVSDVARKYHLMHGFEKINDKLIIAELFGFHFVDDADITVECDVMICNKVDKSPRCTLKQNDCAKAKFNRRAKRTTNKYVKVVQKLKIMNRRQQYTENTAMKHRHNFLMVLIGAVVYGIEFILP